jgi:hypothetical protein
MAANDDCFYGLCLRGTMMLSPAGVPATLAHSHESTNLLRRAVTHMVVKVFSGQSHVASSLGLPDNGECIGQNSKFIENPIS